MTLQGIARAATLLSFIACGQARTEYRAFWVDTFNTELNNHSDVVAVVAQAKAANANMIVAQVRRRGDSWYLNSLEPAPDFTPIDRGFDPLQDLIEEAHACAIEVHAFTIVGAIWNKNPNFPPSATLGPPLNPDHVFNRHSGYDPSTRQIVPGPDNWLTRTLLPDQAGISFQGHRIGSDFWIDFGHPDAAAYTVDVLMQLVRNYDLDGLHLDRIRYPDLSVSGQTIATGANIGYNPRNVTRFQQRFGIAVGAPPPDPADPLWSQWRRDQVTNLVRRIYLNAIAIRPRLKISAALIAYGDGPGAEESWNATEAYWRVFQDWRGWTEEGILDIAVPMNYKREHIPAQAIWFDHWNKWTVGHRYGRSAMIGLGVYLNSVEGTLRQIRRSLDEPVTGVSLYSLANSDSSVSANPFSIPPGQDTPARGIPALAAALTMNNYPYEDLTLHPAPVFTEPAATPELAWKTSPALGHVMGFAARADGAPVDSAIVTIASLDGTIIRTTSTDGGGFYGGVDLAPGEYIVTARFDSNIFSAPPFEVIAGSVARVDLTVD